MDRHSLPKANIKGWYLTLISLLLLWIDRLGIWPNEFPRHNLSVNNISWWERWSYSF